MARWCWEETKGRAARGVESRRWERKRKEYRECRGWKVGEIEDLRREGELKGENLLKKEKELRREERWRKMRESKFNKWYGRVRGEGMPVVIRERGERR